MTRIATWLAATAVAVVLLLSFPTSRGASTALHVVDSGATAGTSGTTYTGQSVSSRFGPVQVQVVVSGGQIVSATAVLYSTGGRDGEINSWAIPQLQSETTTAQSASIDTVSGATYTSEAYIGSLQSALDQAGLA